MVAGVLMAVFYVAVVRSASGSWTHLWDQVRLDWVYLTLILGGFGTQVTLIAELRYRHRLDAAATATGGVGAGAAVFLTVLGASCADTTPTTDAVLPPRTIKAGSVKLTITPTRFDDRGARFAISLDTHSGELSTDLATSATLDVNGRAWPAVRWSGGGPGGHHRSGELRFKSGGRARGTARLTIAGFPTLVEATWRLAGG